MNLDSLNPEQLDAVRYRKGPLLVVAGAGSGKTRVITSRIAYLIQEGMHPDHIIAITFTNKAAGEMKHRVLNMLSSDGVTPPWISTFHSFCLRLLRRHINEIGYSREFVIYDSADQLSLIKQCMKSAGIDKETVTPKALLNHISSFKNDFLFIRYIFSRWILIGCQKQVAAWAPCTRKI